MQQINSGIKLQYYAAAEVIRTWIRRDGIVSGSRLPSTRTLASQLGFSHAAIARACTVLIASGVLRREGYETTVGIASQPVSPILGAIVVVSYLNAFSRKAAEIFTDRNVSHRIIELSWTRNPNLSPILRKVLAEKPTGVILWTTQLNEDAISILDASKIPVVICADGNYRTSRSSVRTDVYRGAENALNHLYDLGHRHIAHISLIEGEELAECHRAVCLKLNLKSSSELIWKSETHDEIVVRDVIHEGLRSHPEVTALFCEARAAYFATRACSVPERLSVVAFGETSEGINSNPPLTSTALSDKNCTALWACAEIISQVEIIQSGRPRKPATQAFFVPELVLRHSTQTLSRKKITPRISPESSEVKTKPEETWGNVYPFLKKSGPHHWLQLDLASLANHSMTRQHGWLGAEPLKHFPSGLRPIHGVPFRVIDEERNEGRAVITFRSPHSHAGEGRQLPTGIKIPVNFRVRGLYFLHGCGYAQPNPFAQYIIHFQKSAPIHLPLVPLGPSRRIAQQRLGALQPNLQDWWPQSFEQADFPHAHRVAVFDPVDPAAYERSIYSLEWINPRPQSELDSIEVQVDPEAGSALALLAITALLDERRKHRGR